MPPQTPTTEKRTRTRPKTVKINDATEAKLNKLAGIVSAKYASNGGLKVEPSHTQLVEAMVDAALESENGAA